MAGPIPTTSISIKPTMPQGGAVMIRKVDGGFDLVDPVAVQKAAGVGTANWRGAYLQSGTITAANTLVVLQPAQAGVVLTLPNGTADGQKVFIKQLGGFDVVVNGQVDNQAAAITFKAIAANQTPDMLSLEWDQATASWLARNALPSELRNALTSTAAVLAVLNNLPTSEPATSGFWLNAGFVIKKG